MPSAPVLAPISMLEHPQVAPHGHQASRFWAAWDGAGAFASFLCMIHCIGLPLILAAFPGMTFGLPVKAIQDESFHQIVAVIAAILALSAFSKGYREHRSARVIVLGVLGCALLFFATTSARYETGWTVFGSTLLIAAHLDNYRKVKFCSRHGVRHSH